MIKGARGGDSGAAVIEFLGISVLLLIPMVYLVVALSLLQAASYATNAGAREAARIIANGANFDEAVEQAESAARLALEDHGITVSTDERVIAVTCDDAQCLGPSAVVHVEVAVPVALPLLPQWGDENDGPLVVGEATAIISRFRGTG